MKNRLVTLAGALALIAVLGKYYAAPAIAQVVRAAVVKNIDEKGRIPYQAKSSCTLPIFQPTCFAFFPAVPANKRLVIEYVSAVIDKNSSLNEASMFLNDSINNTFHHWPLSMSFRSSPNNYMINTPVLIYVEAGLGLALDAPGSVTEAHITGYLVDLTQ